MNFGYIRVSTDKQTVENQRHLIDRFCRENGIVIDGWIEETISGTCAYDKRKLGRLLKRARKGDLISQRTKEALARLREEGVRLGRPMGARNRRYRLDDKQSYIQKMLEKGRPKREIACKCGVSAKTLARWMARQGAKEAGNAPVGD